MHSLHWQEYLRCCHVTSKWVNSYAGEYEFYLKDCERHIFIAQPAILAEEDIIMKLVCVVAAANFCI